MVVRPPEQRRLTRLIRILVAGVFSWMASACAVDVTALSTEDVTAVDLGADGLAIEDGGRDASELSDFGRDSMLDGPRDDGSERDSGADAMADGFVDATASDAERVDGFDAGSPSFCDPAPGLVACYTFDNGLTRDESGMGHDLVSLRVTAGPGVVASGARLAPPSELRVSDRPAFDFRTAFAVDFWFRAAMLPAAGNRAGLVDKNAEFGVFINAEGDVRCSSRSQVVIASGATNVDEWHHVACTASSDTLTLYVDGERVAEEALARNGDDGVADLYLGADSPNGRDGLRGTLDEMRVWTRTLTPEEVTASAARATP